MRRTGFVSLGLTAAVALAFGILGAPSASGSTGGLDRYPAPELSVDSLLPPTDSRDELPLAFSNDTGQVCVLAIENLRLQRILSGTGYPVPDEATVYDSGEVVEFLAAQSDRTQVSVALLTGSATGGLDVVVLSSSDLCQTWGPPVTAVGSGSPAHAAGTLIAFDRNRIGVMALLFLDTLEFKPYLVASIDDGVSWRPALPLDSAPSAPTRPYFHNVVDVVVDRNGIICAGLVEAHTGSGARLYTARSTDGGLSLVDGTYVNSASREVTSFGFVDQPQEGRLFLIFADADPPFLGSPELKITASGAGTSSEPCAGWLNGLRFALPSPAFPRPAVGKDRASDDHLLAAFRLTSGEIVTTSSSDAGLSWVSPVSLGTDSAGSLSVARTESGSWVVSHGSATADPYARHLTTVEALVSTDDGVSFAPAIQIDDSPPGTDRALPGSIAPAAGDDVVVPYLRFVAGGSSTELFHENTSAGSLGGLGELRLDLDGAAVSIAAEPFVSVASSGSTHVFVAFTATVDGPYPDLFVSRSTDAGYTFSTPVRIGQGVPGSVVHRDAIVAASGADVVVGFSWYEPGTDLLRVAWRASNDHGTTWPHKVEIGAFPWTATDAGAPRVGSPWSTTPSLRLWADGTLYATFTDGQDVTFASSIDGGATIDKLDVNVDQGSDRAVAPEICATSSRLFVSFASDLTPYVIVSSDGGASWATREAMHPVRDLAGKPNLSCGAGDKAIVTFGTFSGEFGWRTWDETLGWLTPGTLTLSPSALNVSTSAFIADPSTIVAAYDETFPSPGAIRVYATRSGDGGATFGPPQRLDSSAPRPGATSGVPVVWQAQGPLGPELQVFWSDPGSGSDFEPVVSRSPDFGSTWLPPERLGQGPDCDGILGSAVLRDSQVSSVGNASVVAWWAPRDSEAGDAIVTVLDPFDRDRDLAPNGADCDDSNGDVYPGAPELADGIDNQCPGDPGFGEVDEVPSSTGFVEPSTFAWTAVPGAAIYQAVKSTSVDFDGGCTTFETAGTEWTDATEPGPGEVFYFVVRVLQPAPGSWGSASDGQPRSVPCAGP